MTSDLQLNAIALHLRDIDYCVTLAKVSGQVDKIMYHTKAIKLLLEYYDGSKAREYFEFVKAHGLTNHISNQ